MYGRCRLQSALRIGPSLKNYCDCEKKVNDVHVASDRWTVSLCETVETMPAGRTTVYDAIRAKHVVSTKGAGSYLAGMAVAIPILNVDGRRHTNNFSKNI